jgi:hypothetical protein
MPQQERVAWVAMELIRSPHGVGAYLVRPGAGGVKARVMNELGVFGWVLFGEGREVREGQVGWLLRMKAEDVDEGGVVAGFSVLDSVLLVDQEGEFGISIRERRKLSAQSTVKVVYTVSAVLSGGSTWHLLLIRNTCTCVSCHSQHPPPPTCSVLLKLLTVLRFSFGLSPPPKSGYRVIGELSCGNELPNGFLDTSRRVENLGILQEKTLQGG